MNEWGVVTVIIALVGLIIAICGPISKNTAAMTKLTVTMETLAQKLTEFESRNDKAHGELWSHSEKQDLKIADHEKRIIRLEGKDEKRL